MLSIFEKIALGIGGLCVALTLAFYALVGLPSTDSVEFIGKARKRPEPPRPAGAPAVAPTPAGPTAEEQEILKKLQEQDAKIATGMRLQQEDWDVPPDLFEHLSTEANWPQELKKAHSNIVMTKSHGTSRLKVHQIAENSLLKHFGIQENDVIELIDGEIVQFSQGSSHELYQRAKGLFQKLREGGSISITVTRNNRPVHLKYALGR